VNRSLRTLDFSLVDPDDHLRERSVSWNPNMPVQLRPKEQVPIDIHFNPTFRVAHFKRPLFAETSFGERVHLVNISGTCHATEIKLSEHSLIFGAVVVNSTAQKSVHLHNFGDLGSKFRFEVPSKYMDYFSVHPREGFVAPHDDVVLTVQFHPKQVSDRTISVDNVRCVLDNHEPVRLTVTGQCIEQPGDTIQTVEFEAEVRKECSKPLQFPPPPMGKNPTDVEWKLIPVVRTEVPSDGSNYWFCPPEVRVPPGGQANIDVIYKPLTMTAAPAEGGEVEEQEDEKAAKAKGKRRPPAKHSGSIFIATPDGQAFVYKLEGTASAPTVDQKIEATIACKTPHVQAVPIQNWLSVMQRFTVQIQLVNPPPDSEAAESIKIHGVESFDLPANLSREYKFNVYAYKEGACTVRLIFTSKRTEEFLVVEADLKFVESGSLGVIKFNTTCRQVAVEPITVSNPLSTAANFQVTCSHPDITFSPDPFTVPPKGEATLDVIFRPTTEGSDEATLTLNSPELGKYPYTVNYNVSAAGLEKTLVLKAPLGSDVEEIFKFHHFAKKPATYTASLEPAPGQKSGSSIGDFIIETKDIKANAATDREGVEVVVAVRFQPSVLAERRALLVLSSPDGGDYKALLVGYAQPPLPQGPIIIKNGTAGNANFLNPFEVATDFTFQVDNPNFSVAQRTQKLDPKKQVQVPVNFKGDKPQGGRLIVSATQVSTPWIFFLKGTMA